MLTTLMNKFLLVVLLGGSMLCIGLGVFINRSTLVGERNFNSNFTAQQCGISVIKPTRYVVAAQVVGGEDTDAAAAHSWPWVVSIRYRARHWQHGCGASILTSRWVVTAAHCIELVRWPADIIVAVGVHDQNQIGIDETHHEVQRIIKQEYWKPDVYANDLALLYLSTDITFSDTVLPICLPEKDVKPGEKCVATGWQETQGTNDKWLLRQVEMTVWNQTSCHTAYSNQHMLLGNSTLCASNRHGNDDMCQADSGGPLACRYDSRWYLQGLVSRRVGCGVADTPGIYTRVHHYVTWIQSHINSDHK